MPRTFSTVGPRLRLNLRKWSNRSTVRSPARIVASCAHFPPRVTAGRESGRSHSGRIYLTWATSVAFIRRAELTERETSMTAANDLAVVHWNSPESNSSTKTAEASVYGYAKRPRERTAKRLSRPDTQLAKTIQFFAVALGQPFGVVGVHRRKRRWPGRAFEKDNERKRPQVTLRQPHLAKRSQIPQ